MVMSKESKSKYALLGMLSLQAMSGYNLKKAIEQGTSNFWNEDFAQIYPILKQLEREGLTTSHSEKQEGRPERHVHTLTEKGWDELKNWLVEPAMPQVERNELLLKLFFSDHIPLAASIEHIQRFRTLQQNLLDKYEHIEQSLLPQAEEKRRAMYWLITLRYGKHITHALLAWCDETIATLQHAAEKYKKDV